jgi:hypothetical protein
MRMLPSPATASGSRHEGAGVAYNLAGMAVLAVLMALCAAYFLDFQLEQSAAPPPATGETLTRTIAGRELHIPTAWFRGTPDEAGGFANQIDLRVDLALEGRAEPAGVEVTLLARSRVQASSRLLDSVYLHQFTRETLAGPPGLVGKPLAAADGYAGETVWYDPLSGEPFVAKCLAPVETGAPARCLRAIVLPSGIGALYAFDETILADWRGFDAAMRRLLTVIGAW